MDNNNNNKMTQQKGLMVLNLVMVVLGRESEAGCSRKLLLVSRRCAYELKGMTLEGDELQIGKFKLVFVHGTGDV